MPYSWNEYCKSKYVSVNDLSFFYGKNNVWNGKIIDKHKFSQDKYKKHLLDYI